MSSETTTLARKARLKPLIAGCANDNGDHEVRRYLFLMESHTHGHINWHTTDDGGPDPAYDDRSDFGLVGAYDLDTGCEL